METLDRGRLEQAARAAAWYADLKETTNASFLPLFFDQSRYLVLKGGGGSGKSIFAGRKVLERCLSEPGHRWLVCRKVARTLRESCFAQLRGQLADHYPGRGAKINRGELRIGFPNGSEILFAGLDDVEKLKSIYNITGIWIEEASELEEGDLNQLDIRLRTEFPYYLQMILSFNPVSVGHWLKGRFFDRRDARAAVHESTYRDNRFLTPAAVRTLEAFRETDEYYYMVYCLGQWGVTGKTVFDRKAVSGRLEQAPPPLEEGVFCYDEEADGVHIGNPRWSREGNGAVRLYRKPEPGRPYVIGGDTAGEGSDCFTAQVLDNITGQQVAVLQQACDEDLYACQVYCLGLYYNRALVGVETNFSTYPVKRLDQMGYPNLYVREVEDEYTGKTRKSYGFQTNRLTRPVILSELIRVVRETPAIFCDKPTLYEMLTFVRNEKLRPEAAPGAHDDLVMALAIAHYIRPQQSMTVKREPEAQPVKLIDKLQKRNQQKWRL